MSRLVGWPSGHCSNRPIPSNDLILTVTSTLESCAAGMHFRSAAERTSNSNCSRAGLTAPKSGLIGCPGNVNPSSIYCSNRSPTPSSTLPCRESFDFAPLSQGTMSKTVTKKTRMIAVRWRVPTKSCGLIFPNWNHWKEKSKQIRSVLSWSSGGRVS